MKSVIFGQGAEAAGVCRRARPLLEMLQEDGRTSQNPFAVQTELLCVTQDPGMEACPRAGDERE